MVGRDARGQRGDSVGETPWCRGQIRQADGGKRRPGRAGLAERLVGGTRLVEASECELRERPGDEGLEVGGVQLVNLERRRARGLLYTSDAADERPSVDLGVRGIIKKKN